MIKDLFTRRVVLKMAAKVLLELIRIPAIFLLLGAMSGFFLESIYTLIGTDSKYFWLGYIAILIIIFVLYRNKLQFSGWYKGKGVKRLPKVISNTLIISAGILLLLPPILSYLIDYL